MRSLDWGGGHIIECCCHGDDDDSHEEEHKPEPEPPLILGRYQDDQIDAVKAILSGL